MCCSEDHATGSTGSPIVGFTVGVLLIAAAAYAAVGPTAAVLGGAALAVLLALSTGPGRRGAWWLLSRALAPAVALAAVAVSLWLAGRPCTPRSTRWRERSGATWLHGGQKLADVRARFGVHWYAWAGWQRTVTRLAMVAVTEAAWLAPYATAAVAALVAAAITAAAVTSRTRARRAAAAKRVRSTVRRPVGAAAAVALPAGSTSSAAGALPAGAPIRVTSIVGTPSEVRA